MNRLLQGLVFLFFIWTAAVEGCTGIKIVAQDGSNVHGRTLEFGMKVDTYSAVVPRGYSFVGMTPEGKGLPYQAKYASLGIFCFDAKVLMDGINEKGLAVGAFYFPGYAEYTPMTAQNQSRALSPIEVPNWILTQFASLEEVKQGLAKIVIVPTVFPSWGSTPPPMHYIVYDQTGKSLVIEPIEGKLVVRDNPIGVFTNSPTFDWHMTNLRNFINLTPYNVAPKKIEGIEFAPFGQGSGMVGLPGDFTPPSRFVRAAIFSMSATPVASAKEAVFQTFHILNQFDIPLGVARAKENGVIHFDYTMITCVRDPQALQYYFKTYEDQSVKMVDLHRFDLEAKEILFFPTTSKEIVKDISSRLSAKSSVKS